MDRYAVFGNPITHSKSPFIHTLFARQTQQNMSYERIEAPLDGFTAAIERFFAEQGRGCNVTVPFKEEAFRLAMQLSPRAKLAGAVNTLKLTDDGLIFGDNTDGAGLVQDLKFHNEELAGKRILLLGAGGAARGAAGCGIGGDLARRSGRAPSARRTGPAAGAEPLRGLSVRVAGGPAQRRAGCRDAGRRRRRDD